MSLKEREEEIVEEFSVFDDPMDQYEYLIDIGKELAEMHEALKTEHNIVKGCQSTVWLHAEPTSDGKVHFMADSNTVITKGIIALLIRALDNLSPKEILTAELNFIERINLKSHLSSQRSNGLDAMLQQMKLFAAKIESKTV